MFAFAQSCDSYWSSSFPSPAALKRKRPSTPEHCSPNAIRDRDIAPLPTGRTLKRWRNNRPSDETVHQYTLAKLFSATKTTTAMSSPVREKPFSALRPEQPQLPAQKQRSLFEILIGRGGAQQQVQPSQQIQVNCEDCDRAWQVERGGLEEDAVRCLGCSRTVCDMGCSASNGEGRVCLECVRR